MKINHITPDMHPPIPSIDLVSQYLGIEQEIQEAILRVLKRGFYVLSDEVVGFEEEFARYIGVSHAVGVASGTDAIELALRSVGACEGDEIITAANTAVATVAAIVATGAKPVLVDVDPIRFTIDPEKVKLAITSHTKAVIPVHLYGCPADLHPILALAEEHSFHIVEDCAQAHGARYQGRCVGSWGIVSAFSFYPTKNLGAYGDGGAVVTSDSRIAEHVRELRQYGWKRRYVSDQEGINSRLDEIQAAILRVKLRHLDDWNKKRQQLADRYRFELTDSKVILPITALDGTHVYHQFVIRSSQRDLLQSRLREANISTQILYPLPVHLQPAYSYLGYGPGDFPVTEILSREILSLPLYPEMDEDWVKEICGHIKEVTES